MHTKAKSLSQYNVLQGRKKRIEQGSQTRGPRAACGLPDALVRPANTSKHDKSLKFDQIKLYLRAFLAFCGPQKLFSYKLGPAEHFFSRMWPSNQFEFETLGIE
jgi:hypothetical protein